MVDIQTDAGIQPTGGWMYGGTADSGLLSVLSKMPGSGRPLSNSANDIREMGFEMLEELYREDGQMPDKINKGFQRSPYSGKRVKKAIKSGCGYNGK